MPDGRIGKSAYFFHHMAACPWPFMLILPAIFVVLIVVGWTQPEVIIEEDVANIWVPTENQYAKDTDYVQDLFGEYYTPSSVAAMAVARDRQNLLVPSRLEEIRQRMEETEGIEVEVNGKKFYYDDICATNSSPYRLPCLRLSPMDFFQEARWYFNELERVAWYRGGVQDALLKPRIPRFSTLTSAACATQADGSASLSNVCDSVIAYRYSTGNPLGLFADIGDLELSDPCRICYDQAYEATVQQLFDATKGAFTVLTLELQRALTQKNWTDDSEGQAAVAALLTRSSQLMNSITEEDVDEFYYYYVVRGLYAQLAVPQYMTNYQQFGDLINLCPTFGGVCPSPTVTEQEAAAALYRHADNVFSSVTTAGIPYPFWSSGDGTGYLFGGSEPVSGSGVDMSGELLSLLGFLDVPYYGKEGWSPLYEGGVIDPDPENPVWVAAVEKNPIYAWFMSSLTPADHMCGNGDLTGFRTGIAEIDGLTAAAMAAASSDWCTKYDVPNEQLPIPGPYTKQHFAKMWYDLLLASPAFLNVQQSVSDPYTWTNGNGCEYNLGGERIAYTNATLPVLQQAASGHLYNIDEGASIGPVTEDLLIGGATPPVGEFSVENPVEEIRVLQTLYSLLLPRDIVQRVKNCARPGGPLNITLEEAQDVQRLMKEKMEDTWSRGWDDPSQGEVQFSIFIDDDGEPGTFSRALKDYTFDNSILTVISILVIAFFTVLFMYSPNLVESQVLLSLMGVGLVVLGFFAALGFSLMMGIKINIAMGQSLPYIMIGLGVNDIYIILQALKKQEGYSENDYLKAMDEVVVPVTMTSIVNASMFAVLNISDIPAVYLTAQSALYAVIALYLVAIFCYPAFCYLDLKRQSDARLDVLFCVKSEAPPSEQKADDFRGILLFENFYRPLVLGDGPIRIMTHFLIWAGAIVLFALGVYGINEREVGLGVEDFFPSSNQASLWASIRTQELASWPITMNWGQLNYTNPDEQMRMIKQFEDVVDLPMVSQLDTNQLWMANFLLWSTRMCDANFDRSDFSTLACGSDQYHADSDSYCSGTWAQNKHGLKLKTFTTPSGECEPYSGGICRPFSKMHIADVAELGLDPEQSQNEEYCPVIDGWSDEKWQFCLVQWRNITGYTGGGFVVEDDATSTACPGVSHNDASLQWPIPYSNSPGLFAYKLYTHEDHVELIQSTDRVCADDKDLHCWVSGIPYEYWSQYDGIFSVLVELCGYSTLVGFAISWLFLYSTISVEKVHPQGKVVMGSLFGALVIAAVILVSLVTVVGLSILSDVTLTGFSNMSFALSVAFSVEYSVHIVSRWLRAPTNESSGIDRVCYTMSFLMVPTFMSFVSSTIGVICLGFTDFNFTEVYYFRPLIIVMCVTWFYGCWWLPSLLTYLNFEGLRFPQEEDCSAEPMQDKQMTEKAAGSDTDKPVETTEDNPAEPTRKPDAVEQE